MTSYDNFRAHNRDKLSSLREVLTTQRWNAFCAVPYLVHYDSLGILDLPENVAPYGFVRPYFHSDFEGAAENALPRLRSKLAPPRQHSFLGLYAMGSVGSACFTTASDIDYWLVHDAQALSMADREYLEKKLVAIEQWAERTTGLEIHFYLHDLAEIQKSTFSYDKESAGEFGPILKEEFLRTATHIAGAEPAFWQGDSGLAIDFGPLPRLTTKQYLAACLMLLEKAFEKPFKAALKIALLRRLAARPDDQRPAEIYIERAGQGRKPDPYMLVLEYLWDFFNAIGKVDEHEFLKTVLYLKMIAEEDSIGRIRKNQDRLTTARFQTFGGPIDMHALNEFFHWPLQQRIKFSDRIVSFLQHSLREISQYPDARALPPEKFQALTRKIRARQRGGNYLESLTFADVPSKGEACITFVKDDRGDEWSFVLDKFVGRPEPDKLHPIRRAPSPIPLFAFALKNNLINTSKTEIRAYPSDQFPRRSNEIVQRMADFVRGSSAKVRFDEPERPDSHFIVVEQLNPNKQETRFATVLSRTTWKEFRYETFRGEHALFNALSSVMSQPAPHSFEYFVDVPLGPDPSQVVRALELAGPKNPETSHILQDQNGYILIANRKVSFAPTVKEVLFTLGRAGGRCTVDSTFDNPATSIAARIFGRRGESNRVYLSQGGHETVFLLVDNQGHSYAWKSENDDARFALDSSVHFLQELAPHVAVESFEILYKKGLADPWTVTRIPVGGARSIPRDNAVCLELHEEGLASAEIGSKRIEHQPIPTILQVLARFIASVRRSNLNYPAHIHSVRFPAQLRGRLGIADAVRMKHELETRIGKFMQV